MRAYTLEDVQRSLSVEAVMLRDVVRVKLIPINMREEPNKEFLVTSAFGIKETVSREELENSGYTYLSGKKLKLRTMSSKKEVYLLRNSNKNIKVVYIPYDSYLVLYGKKISDRYVVLDEDGNVGTCSKKVFRKTCIIKPDVRIYRAIDKRGIEKYIPIGKTMEGRYLNGYVFESQKTGIVSSFTVKESVELCENGLIIGDVKVVKAGNSNKLGGADIDKLGKLN